MAKRLGRKLGMAGIGALLLGGLFIALPSGQAPAVEPPAEQAMAPDFALPDQAGKLRRLEDFRGDWLVLYFYPKDDTPGCTEEACQFRDDIMLLQALGAEVVGISVDDVASHAEFARKHSLPFPLLADVGGNTAAAYGGLTDLKLVRFAKRRTFIIDPYGRIARRYLDVDPKRHSDQVYADLVDLVGLKSHVPGPGR